MSNFIYNFDKSSIKVLDGREVVRKRPAVYIGDTSDNSLDHLSEVVARCFDNVFDSPIDEALASYCDELEASLIKVSSSLVEDNIARASSKDKPQKKQRPALDVAMNVLNAGSKPEKKTEKVTATIIDLFAGCGAIALTLMNGRPKSEELNIETKLADIFFEDEIVTSVNKIYDTYIIYKEEDPLAASIGDDAVKIVMSTRGLIYGNAANIQTAWFDAGRGSGGLPYLPPFRPNNRNIKIDKKHLDYSLLIPKIITAGDQNEAANSLAA